MGGSKLHSQKRVEDYRNADPEATFDTSAQTATSAHAYRHDSVWSQTANQTKDKVATDSNTGDIIFQDGKPDSKTSLGKVYYPLGPLPSLFLIDVDVTTAVPALKKGLQPISKGFYAITDHSHSLK